MSRVIAIANQKGGVSKTTTTVNLGIGLARKGKKVLVIDADPQSSLTESLGFHQTDQLEVTLSSIMEKIMEDEEVGQTEGILYHAEGIDLLPCNIFITYHSVHCPSHSFLNSMITIDSMTALWIYILNHAN